MAPYSMDLRERVARAWDASGDADDVAATFAVSRAWVHRLVQRRRETGSIAPRQQTKFRSRVLAGQEARLAALITARPDATLAELREALPHDGGAEHAVAGNRSVGPHRQKKPYTPTNNAGPTSPLSVGGGATGSRFTMSVSMSFSMNAASRPICYGATAAARAAPDSAITPRAVTGRPTR